MRIIYIIDFNCPNSYIGLTRIRKAVKNLNLDVEWEMRSFELEDEAGKRPLMSTAERYAEKYGMSQDEALEKIRQIEKAGKDDGLEINFRNMPLTSSKDALRLCKYTQNMRPDITLRLADEIFHSRLCKNENIADNDVLTDIAISCGVEESEARKIIENNYYNIECFLDLEEALSSGITATPCFIIEKNGEKLIIPGVFSQKEFEIALKDFDSGEIENKTI